MDTVVFDMSGDIGEPKDGFLWVCGCQDWYDGPADLWVYVTKPDHLHCHRWQCGWETDDVVDKMMHIQRRWEDQT